MHGKRWEYATSIMGNIKQKPGISDVLLTVGIFLMSVGLYLIFGVGVSLTTVGAVFLILGLLITPRGVTWL